MHHNNNQSQIVSAIIVAAFIIGGAILLKDSSPSSAPIANNNTPQVTGTIRAITKDDHIMGNPNAKITIVEYSDTECPFCKQFHNTLQDVIKARGNEVNWVYRHFPIASLHSKAPREAQATECAWEQGGNTAFWKYIDRVFEITPSNDGLNDQDLMDIAKYAGLNQSQFYTCLESGKYEDKVNADIADAQNLQVNGTPMSFIVVDGEIVGVIPGSQPITEVFKLLDAAKK